MLPLTASQQRRDVALAAVLFVGALISATLSSVSGIYGVGEDAGMLSAVVYSFVLAVPLAFRRRFPGIVAIVVATAYFVAVTIRIPEVYAGSIAMFITIYTVGAWSTDRRRAHWVRIGIITGMFVWLLTVMFIDATQPTDEGFSRAGAFSPYVAYTFLTLLINGLFFGGAYYFGERTYAAMQQRRVLEERTAELERERELTAAQAVALERVRIARELHDVVAHHVSLMGVQAGAARTIMAQDPDAASATLAAIEGSARSALAELRHLLEALRTSPEAPDTAPTTLGLEALPGLVAEAEGAGLPTEFRIVGEPGVVPETVQVNLYRIAQEALTNARRHGGTNARADVRLRYTDDSVELEIANTGRAVRDPKPGMGHIGMRERAAASGGSVELLPRSSGGFLVRVRVPRQAAPAAGDRVEAGA
ncbi:sensor histidine kinase [Microbacterium sp. cx-55]|uniref:sensor histidine kinase n=1 Tax=Microbacterium sp. cx-55 TaxID=2875948 RepID=UPI001CBCB556|nr:sensor histidine kinase [Microbacterium sp. cx-55]MBZ4488407.1 sensor histidine kinase [Microbacterium sp. cx-55]UGB35059.1 sensor histidine kinase [Microbacterium sp. cx-55]